jgi:hypothetical protein
VNTRIRAVAISAVLLIAFALMNESFHLINQPSDTKLYEGLGLILLLIAVVPGIVSFIWRGGRA